MSAAINPLGDYVVAQAEEASSKTASGLFLPNGAAEKPKVAKVIAVGPGKVGDDNERVPMTVKAGDRILYKNYSETEVKVDGVAYLLVKEEDVLATIK